MNTITSIVSEVSESDQREYHDAPEKVAREDLLTAAKGGSVSFAGRLFEYAVRFILGIVIARALGVEQYGLYTLGITVALIASNVAMLGLQVGMVRFLPPAIRQKDAPTIRGILQICVGLPALVSLVLAAGLFLLASPIANLVFHDPRLYPVLCIVSLLIPLETLSFLAYTVTISYKKPQYSVIANNIVVPLAKLILAVAFLSVGYSTLGVLVAQVVASLIGMWMMLYFVNLLFSLKHLIGYARRNSRQLLGYSLPAYLGWIVNTVRSSLTTIVLGVVGLTAGVGVFAAASRFSMIGSMFYLAIGNISTPIIADLHSNRQSIQMKAYYQTTTRWLLMFNLPVFLTSVLFAKPLLSIFGDDFTAGATSMMVLAIGTLVYTCTGVGANILDMTDHPKVNTVNSVFMLFITIALTFVFVPKQGVVGAAIATSLSTVLVNLVCLIEVWVLLGMHPYNRSFIKPVVSGLIAALVAFLLFQFLVSSTLFIHLVVGAGALWSVYGLMLFLLKLSPEDRIVIERLLSWFRHKLSIVPEAIR